MYDVGADSGSTTWTGFYHATTACRFFAQKAACQAHRQTVAEVETTLAMADLARDDASAERTPVGSAAMVCSLADEAGVLVDLLSAAASRCSWLGGDLLGDLQTVKILEIHCKEIRWNTDEHATACTPGWNADAIVPVHTHEQQHDARTLSSRNSASS